MSLVISERVIPLTPAGALWSQREYVAAHAIGVAFSAHRATDLRQWFHYGFPGDIGCTSVLVGPSGPIFYVDHTFERSIDWLAKCRHAVEARGGEA